MIQIKYHKSNKIQTVTSFKILIQLNEHLFSNFIDKLTVKLNSDYSLYLSEFVKKKFILKLIY